MTDKPTDATIDAASKICNNMGLGLHAVIIMLNTNLNKAKRQLADAEALHLTLSETIAGFKSGMDKAQARLDELQYRHECLKSLYEDATNCKDPAQAETDIDEFIREEQLHS